MAHIIWSRIPTEYTNVMFLFDSLHFWFTLGNDQNLNLENVDTVCVEFVYSDII